MSDWKLPRRPKPPIQNIKADELSPEELAAMEERSRKYDHNHTVILNVLDDLAHPFYKDRRDLVSVIVGLLDHLTPEQALALADRLPSHLPAEAAARLAAAAKSPITLNGGPAVPAPTGS
jgi:hypothetical protein